MDDKRRMNTTDEDVDLSGMINEYSQDNELRKKIEELKKQKEEEKRIYASRQQEISQGSIFDNISDTGSFKRTDTQKQGGIPDIRVDDTQLDKTRVGFDDAPAYDKTLVIMNNKTKASSADQTQIFGEDQTAVFHAEDVQEYDDSDEEVDEAEEDIYEEDDDDNLLARIKEKKQRKEEAKRNMRQDDEDDEEEDDSDKSTKMNKIITYVIIGIVGICIIAGAFFGVKYALSNFLGGSDDKDKVTDKNKTDTTDKNNGKTETNTTPNDSDDDKKNEIQTNQAEAAQLQKQLDQYESQLDEVNKELAAAKKDKTAAQSELDSYKELLNNAVLLKTQAEEIGTLLNTVNELAKYKDSTVPEEKTQYDAALKAYNDACAKYGVSDYNEALQKSNTANEDYNTKAQAAEQKRVLLKAAFRHWRVGKQSWKPKSRIQRQN